MMNQFGKLFVSGISLMTISTMSAAQSSIGIGTNNPNPKSVLHLEAPAGNQGLLLPRLTTAQMQANPFFNSLGIADKGLTVYDTDRNQMFSWDGTGWKSSAKFSLPYVDSLENAPAGTNLMRLIYKGNIGNPVGGIAVENLDPNNAFSPLYLFTNSLTQGAADFVVNNNQNQNDALGAVSNGIGRAGSFRINNANNANAALYATTNGKEGSSAVLGENTGNGIGVKGTSNSSNFFTSAVYGEHTGTGDAAGVFRIKNNQNAYAGLYGETNGSGPAIYAQQLGTGRGGQFEINNENNSNIALRGYTSGTGSAGAFTIANSNSGAPALSANTNGTGGAANFTVDNTESTVAAVNAVTNGKTMSVALRGQATNGGTAIAGFSSGNTFVSPAIFGEHSGTGDAAGVFRITNASNIYSAVYGETSGSGASFFGRQTGTGRAGQFQINNPANPEAAIRGFTDGLGRAAFFTINNASNAADGVHTTTNGSGRSVYALNSGTGSAAKFESTNSANTNVAVEIFSKSQSANGLNVILEGGNVGDAIYAEKTTGFGSAGNFQNQNASNNASILFAGTNAQGGSALGSANFGNGNAITIWGGGLRLSTGVINSSGNIDNRSAAYEITGGTTFTINFPLNNGETFFFYNNTASAATVNGISIPPNSGRTCIVLSNTLRGM